MIPALPKIKDNLVVQANSVEGVTYYTIKDPSGEKYIRLREPEYSLLCSFDGSRTPEEAAADFVRTYHTQLPVQAVEQFVARIGELGFLEGVSAIKPAVSKSALFIKLKAFNPEKLLDWLYPLTQWLFSGAAVWIQLALIVVGGVVFVANIAQFPFSLAAILRAADIATIIVSFFLIITIHEFAHALACRRFGGRVREMGFLLLYFQPCFYCNLSDAYLFPERRQRIIVTLAGVFFQTFLWAAFALLWRLTGEEYFLNRVFYLTAAVCFATLAFNLNPAIKLDGYYLLADWVQIPNLRQKAFNFVWSRIKVRLFGCAPPEIAPSPREAAIYRYYGALSITYSFALILFVLYRGGELLIGKWGGVGFVLFIALSLTIFRRLFARWLQAFLSVWDERKRVWMKPKRVWSYAITLAAILLLGILIRIHETTGGPARLLAAESYIVRRVAPSLLEGRCYRGGLVDQESSQLFQLSSSDFSVTRFQPRASIGDTVRAGDTLLVINSTLNAGLLAEAGSDLKKAEAERRLLLSDPKVEEIAKKESEIEQAEAIYEAARKEFVRVKELHAKALISDDSYERSSADFKVATSAWNTKKSELKLLKAAPKAAAIESIDAEIEKLQARRSYLENQLDESTIISPFTGVLIGVADARDLFQLARTESLIVEINLDQSDLDILYPGARVEVRVAAFPSEPRTGSVLKLKLSPRLQAIAAIVNHGQVLLPEMSGYAKVECRKISLAGLLLRKVSRFFRLEFWSWF
jgi:putative peptide zinc metalloprotease protein